MRTFYKSKVTETTPQQSEESDGSLAVLPEKNLRPKSLRIIKVDGKHRNHGNTHTGIGDGFLIC